MNTKKFKTQDFANHMATSYRLDLLESIEQAKAGTLSPSGVEYCLEEIGMLRGTEEWMAGTLEAECMKLTEEQRAVVQSAVMGVIKALETKMT